MKIRNIMEKAALNGGITIINGEEPTDGYIVALCTIATSELLDKKLVRILRKYIPAWGLWFDPDKAVWCYEIVRRDVERIEAKLIARNLRQKCYYDVVSRKEVYL